mgnify:FL=1
MDGNHIYSPDQHQAARLFDGNVLSRKIYNHQPYDAFSYWEGEEDPS